MKPTSRSVPEWKAPDTLLPRVLMAVNSQTPAPQGFYAWSTMNRMLFYWCVAGAVSVALAVSAFVGPALAPNISTDQLFGALDGWYAVSRIIRNAGFALLNRISGNAALLFVASALCTALAATWAFSVSSLYFLLTSQHKGAKA